MQCGCPECNTIMAKRERGLKSECVCPWCGFACNICAGKPTDDKPAMEKGMGRDAWAYIALERGITGENPDGKEKS